MKLIVDLEASCWSDRQEHRGENETIEIGCVVTDDQYEPLSEFQSFVRPVRNPKLSVFCTDLTTITQAMVASAPSFPEAMLKFEAALKQTYHKSLADFTFCSWGNYDRNQFEKDCLYHKIAYPFGPHVNVKSEVAKKLKVKPMGAARAASFLNIPFSGTHHRGIDDARVIAKICRTVLGNALERKRQSTF